MSNWQLLFTSTVAAGVISAMIAGAFNIRTQNKIYENEYYKHILANRIKAYELVARIISLFKQAMVDEDGKTFHFVFSSDKTSTDLLRTRFELSEQSIWLSDEMFTVVKKVDHLLLREPESQDDRIEYAKRYYDDFWKLRDELVKLHRRDSLSLHKVRKFLKKRTKPTVIEEVKLRD